MPPLSHPPSCAFQRRWQYPTEHPYWRVVLRNGPYTFTTVSMIAVPGYEITQIDVLFYCGTHVDLRLHIRLCHIKPDRSGAESSYLARSSPRGSNTHESVSEAGSEFTVGVGTQGDQILLRTKISAGGSITVAAGKARTGLYRPGVLMVAFECVRRDSLPPRDKA